ncbi:helix-turn-helix domain-containing protein [Paenibacillus sp. N3/727]|uniref:helix-turn-helix domain-containing protein n=1 Tax=Paenibacillus sp. N3/727 TaxID=2925845 RepID=UPI001F536B65|nr:helix-turn-helix domain-containing protein [Paenibacillus sp. N3/727]UNK20193.1 helix-turn-helix domain-containing protein [Paenibacillus sp. N3/727]
MTKNRKLEPYEEEFLKLIAKGFQLLMEEREQELKNEIAQQVTINIKEDITNSSIKNEHNNEAEILPPVCTISDVMSYFRLSRSTVSKLISTGKLKSFKYGNKPRIKREWILEYEESLIKASLNNEKGRR